MAPLVVSGLTAAGSVEKPQGWPDPIHAQLPAAVKPKTTNSCILEANLQVFKEGPVQRRSTSQA